jgi:CRP/FNR family transcriptional regulator, cyclic AMP receptor protein
MTDLPPAIDEAACKGILARLTPQMRSRLLSSGRLNVAPSGTLLYVAEDQPQFVGLILNGFLRVFVAATSGRESTIRYVRPGDLLGVVAALSGPSATWVQTLADSQIWMLDPVEFRRAVQTELPIATVMAEECARRVAGLVNEIAGSAFATVRQRIAHHLLSLARSRPAPPFLVAHITQADLAGAAGSVREVTVRELRALKDEGLVRPVRGGIAILDPDRLERIAAELFKAASET